MLNKMLDFIRQREMVSSGDRVVCAVSGGADSVALLFGMYLLRGKLGITLEAAHFNHHLRGEESDGDEAFVAELCRRYEIPLYLGGGKIVPGKKGLEAAAREARYQFLRSLPGKIATAHTADDNAETVLMHLIRGTGLKGLGAIAPISGNVIRPMLTVTREEVEAFLAEYHLPHREDSSNAGDQFLRNRIRHSVMPLLRRENPQISRSLSETALRLREDACFLEKAMKPDMPGVTELREMPQALRRRYLERFLKESGVKEPEQNHFTGAEKLVFSPKPSARMEFPGGVVIAREYDRLVRLEDTAPLPVRELPCPGSVDIPEIGLRALAIRRSVDEEGFPVVPVGKIVIRSRQPEDRIRTPGGTKSLKKIMVDRKIPAASRCRIPVVADEKGIIGVYGIGENLDRQEKDGFLIVFRELGNKT